MDGEPFLRRLPGADRIPVATSLGFLAATVAAVAAGSGTLLQRSVAAVLPVFLSLRLAAHARDLDLRDDYGDLGTVVGWTAGGTAVMALIVGWFAFVGLGLGVAVPPAVASVTALAAGALLGTLVGRYSVEARRQVEAATRAEVEREYTRRQRERIALLNRILGHHTRNAVNVVTLSAEALAPHVDGEGEDHVEAIRDRGARLSETVGVIQDVAETLAEVRELRERDAAAVVRDELERARERYPEAEFRADALPESAPALADELFERVVRAQLENAVEHSDRETPTVRVDLEDGDDAVRVRVADDGPGVPDDRKDLVFDAGDRGTTTEGDGLELFLADAVVDRYGGSIDVGDNDPRGAVFHTTVPKPGAGSRGADRDLDVNPAILPR